LSSQAAAVVDDQYRQTLAVAAVLVVFAPFLSP
jgi:hypothetical protein